MNVERSVRCIAKVEVYQRAGGSRPAAGLIGRTFWKYVLEPEDQNETDDVLISSNIEINSKHPNLFDPGSIYTITIPAGS